MVKKISLRSLDSTVKAAVDSVIAGTAGGGGVTSYVAVADLPLIGNSSGDLAYVEGNNRLYLWTGVGWFNIALINTNPTITQGPNPSYAFATDGTPIVLTLVASDPEGIPITWSHQVTSGTLGNTATISQNDNVFTVTPSTNEADVGTFGVTFTASDGVNIATAFSSFTLLFDLDWSATTQQSKLVASNPVSSSVMGWSIAIAGDTVVVGAFGYISGQGAAYVFTRTNNTWTEQAVLLADDQSVGDNFGRSVSISGDTVVVGAWNEDPAGVSDAGSAYVFTRSGTTWTQQAKLVASDRQSSDYFGDSVSIDGDTIVVGAFGEDAMGSGAGAAYVFTRSGTTWTQQAKLVASDGFNNYEFGKSVSVKGDTLVVGSIQANAVGAAYVFTRSGTTWTQQAKLVASDAQTNDQFGWSVSIDGDTIVVGAYFEDPGATDAGSAYVFTRSGTTWTQQAKLVASDRQASDQFGWSVSIDGDTIVVGAYIEDPGGVSDAGAVYVFTRSGTTWTQQAKLVASDRQLSDHFGISVAVSYDTVAVGAWGEDPDGVSDAGAAYIFVAG